MLQSLEAGEPISVPEEPTLANALAGGIGLDNRFSFALVQAYVDEHLVVTEAQIAAAIRYAATRLRLVVEGGGAVGLAAALSGLLAPRPAAVEGPVVILVSGGNLDPARLADLLRTS